MASSVEEAILDAVADTIRSLNFVFIPPVGNQFSPEVKVLKQPKFQRSLDEPLPVINVCPDHLGETIEPASKENQVFVTYTVEVFFAGPGNRDFETYLDLWLKWRLQIRQAFNGTTMAAVPEVVDQNPVPDTAIDRALMQQNYDKSSIKLKFLTIEARSL